jgi:hypothetical protein
MSGPSAKRVVQAMVEEGQRVGTQAALLDLLGMMRALHWLHWTVHWQSKGDPFYGDHLLFERLYKGMVGEIDTLAEKCAFLFDRAALSPHISMSVVQKWMDIWGGDPLPGPLVAQRAEEDLQAAIRNAYNIAKASGGLSLGLDDFLMSLANAHETNLYLLKQRLYEWPNASVREAAGRSMKPDGTAEGLFFDHPRMREVREFAQSKAISNLPGVGSPAGKGEAPPSPTKIVDTTPGSGEFSTLSRYVVETEHPTDSGVPDGHDEVPKHPRMVGLR